METAVVILVLAIAGLIDSLAFFAVYSGRARNNHRIIPQLCSSENGVCMTLSDTPESHILRIPNSVSGIIYYSVIIAASLFRLISGNWPLILVLTEISIAAAFVSLYLAYSLIFRLRVFCKLCFVAHIINVTLAGIFISILL